MKELSSATAKRGNKALVVRTQKASNPTCDHQVTIKGLCGMCGCDIRAKSALDAGKETKSASASVSMVHRVPELLVSAKMSREIGRKDRDLLLAARKLVLLVDLDQTLIHTTDRPLLASEASAEVFAFTIFKFRYFTKIRPHAIEFLRRTSVLYELHIVSFGTRIYAHKIARMLDPDCKLFHQRILSRDELVSSVHKTKNIKDLFPLGDELVVMIDDRPDVWEFSDALIQVKPYRYFKQVGDINAPVKAYGDGGVISDARPKVDIAQRAEEDSALLDAESFLRDIHSEYYKKFDESGEVTDVKHTIVSIRERILEDEMAAAIEEQINA